MDVCRKHINDLYSIRHSDTRLHRWSHRGDGIGGIFLWQISKGIISHDIIQYKWGSRISLDHNGDWERGISVECKCCRLIIANHDITGEGYGDQWNGDDFGSICAGTMSGIADGHDVLTIIRCGNRLGHLTAGPLVHTPRKRTCIQKSRRSLAYHLIRTNIY